MVPRLKHLFCFKGLTSSAQAVLSGEYVPPDRLDPRVKDLLNELCTPDSVCNLGKRFVDLTMASYQAFWRKAKVNTSCYPSALSFAMLQADASDNLTCDFECSMTRIPLKAGYSPIRWRKMLDVMILKWAGHTNLSNLRTIVLFQPDCNFAFKHVGRGMMKTAEATGALAPEQYGSRKRHRAIDLAVNKVLTNDVL
jgi:hypothetical protein